MNFESEATTSTEMARNIIKHLESFKKSDFSVNAHDALYDAYTHSEDLHNRLTELLSEYREELKDKKISF
ncbi:MAG: hypothetical protein ACYS8W_07485 [Planctomycetota bacterium]